MGGDVENPLLKPHQRQFPSSHNRRGRVNFPVGSLVEVRTDEEDFKGVYFSATVTTPSTVSPKKGSRKKPKQLFVEYHNLLAHEDGSDRLREYVDVSFVRPAPPLQEIVKCFDLDDVVDAFYKDGWWTGVVCRVVDGGDRYVVTFQSPPDELEFGLSELRVHWDWVNGSWVRPQKQSIAGLMFDVGRKVEVSFDREDFQDAWFPATVHEELGNGVFLVEYIGASADNRGQAVKATVDSLHVRPCPPLLKDKNFVLLEKVDAFFEFGWWSGVITKELENSKYLVFFKQMKQDKEFYQSELRPHMEWKDGKWFTSSQQVGEGVSPRRLSQEVQSSDDVVHEYNTPENSSASAPTAPVKSSVDGKNTCEGKTPLTSRKGDFEQLTADNQKMSHVTTSLTKRRQYLSNSGSALSQHPQKLKEGNLEGENYRDRHDKTNKEVSCGFASPDSVNNMEFSATQTTGDQSCNPSWENKIQKRQRNIRGKQDIKGKTRSKSSSTKKSSTEMLPLESLEFAVGGSGKEPDAAGNTEEDAQKEYATELPIIVGLPCANTGSSLFGISGVKSSHHSKSKEIVTIVNDQEHQLNNSTIQKIPDGTQTVVGESNEKRKRGRPKKILVESTQTPVSGNAQNGVDGSGDFNRKDDGLQRSLQVELIGIEASISDQEMAVNKEKLDNDRSSKYKKARMTKRTLHRAPEEKGVQESGWLGENRLLKRGRIGMTSGRIAVQVRGSVSPSGGNMMEVDRTGEVEKVVGEVFSNEFDNEPLSKWIEEIQSPSVINGSGTSPEGIAEQCMANSEKQRDGVLLDEDSERQPESGTQASALVDNGLPVSSEPQSLPFVKNTSLWKTIESMEVFQKIPQKPHFQPLEQVKESSREGLAVGLMVTFASLVEKVSRLQLNDPKSMIDDIMETVADLERHGFDVSSLQDRVTKLLAAKDKEVKLVDEVNDLNNQLLEHNCEKTRIEEEIREINEHIRKWQEKLSLAESVKEKEDDEVASLQARVKETEESIKNLRGDFNVQI